MPEAHFSVQHLLAAVIDRGSASFDEISEALHPGGMTASRKGAPGDQTPVRNRGRLRARLRDLVKLQHLVLDGQTYRLGPAMGTVMVMYLGRRLIYTSVYDATGTLLDSASKEYRIEMRQEPQLDVLLRVATRELAALMRRQRWEHQPPRALAVGLPAAVDMDGDRVASADPPRWKNLPTLRGVITEEWQKEMRRGDQAGLPPMPRAPRLGDDGQQSDWAITIDSDIVMDTIGAMYERPATPGPHFPAHARAVMGVKVGGGVRSTLIFRGQERLFRSGAPLIRRLPGQRRDSVFRGRYGDTVGLGHSIALLHRSRDEAEESEQDADDVVGFWRSIREGYNCSCGATDVPHLESFVSHHALARRLGIDADQLSEVLNDHEDGPRAKVNQGNARRVLQETGRLLAYALDTGVRLYDPEAVLLTGGVVYSDVVWRALLERSELGESERRTLVRAPQLHSDDPNDPIGPRGAARLAADTWIYPSFLMPGSTH